MVRAKFKCVEKTEQVDSNSFKFNVVTEGSEENKEFFKWTPSGQLSLGCTNKAVDFVVGKEYYLDISEAV